MYGKVAIHILAPPPGIWREIRRWIFHIGGLGFIPLGIIDNSVIPLPGSMDIMTIVLSARDETWWLYYAAMGTAGSLIGGYLTYRIGIRGGKAALRTRFSLRVFERLCNMRERWRFSSVFLPALLPPPLPMVPFLLAAGTLQYPGRKFLMALASGRAVRYTVLAYLGGRYWTQAVEVLRQAAHPLLWIIIAEAMLAALVAGGIGMFIREHSRVHGAHA